MTYIIQVMCDTGWKTLCQDGMLRQSCDWGDYPECIKVYRTLGWARKRACWCVTKSVRVVRYAGDLQTTEWVRGPLLNPELIKR